LNNFQFRGGGAGIGGPGGRAPGKVFTPCAALQMGGGQAICPTSFPGGNLSVVKRVHTRGRGSAARSPPPNGSKPKPAACVWAGAAKDLVGRQVSGEGDPQADCPSGSPGREQPQPARGPPPRLWIGGGPGFQAPAGPGKSGKRSPGGPPTPNGPTVGGWRRGGIDRGAIVAGPPQALGASYSKSIFGPSPGWIEGKNYENSALGAGRYGPGEHPSADPAILALFGAKGRMRRPLPAGWESPLKGGPFPPAGQEAGTADGKQPPPRRSRGKAGGRPRAGIFPPLLHVRRFPGCAPLTTQQSVHPAEGGFTSGNGRRGMTQVKVAMSREGGGGGGGGCGRAVAGLCLQSGSGISQLRGKRGGLKIPGNLGGNVRGGPTVSSP